MKHNSLQRLVTVYHLVKVGGNHSYRWTDTSYDDYIDERKGFVNLVRTHGYDVLTEKDKDFMYCLNEYNRVRELEAKKHGESSYEKYLPKELCICGEWMFTEIEYVTISKAEVIKDIRGGKREGAGRKARHSKLIGSQTAVIRVPDFYKKDIKDLIDWLIEKAEEGQDVNSALFWAERALEEEGDKENAQLLEELSNKLPHFFVKKAEY